MLKLNIKIQSVSGIITNSSSEVFCRIDSNCVDVIYDLLSPLFPARYSDDGPVLYRREEDGVEYLEIDMPYHISDCGEFFRAGLEALLDAHVPNNYTIDYDVDY